MNASPFHSSGPLPAGVTGFFGPGDRWLQPADPREFRTLCHSLAREAGGRVLKTDETLMGKNFYVGTLLLPAGPCCLLRNAYFPCLAFSSSADPAAGSFLDSPVFPASPPLQPVGLNPQSKRKYLHALCIKTRILFSHFLPVTEKFFISS